MDWIKAIINACVSILSYDFNIFGCSFSFLTVIVAFAVMFFLLRIFYSIFS